MRTTYSGQRQRRLAPRCLHPALAGLLAAAAAGLVTGQIPARRNMNADFQVLPIPNASAVYAVTLVESKGAVLVYATQTGQGPANVLQVRPGGPVSPKPLATIGEGERPRWDAFAAARESLSVVGTVSGSAVLALSLWNTGAEEPIPVNRLDGFGVFRAPRFVKGEAGAVSSLAYVDGESVLVLFPVGPDGQYGKFRRVALPGTDFLEEALLVHSGEGYLLFTKDTIPGSGAAGRKNGAGFQTNPGILHLVTLDREFHPIGPAVAPLGGQEIFEFDANVFRGGVAVFATTPKGYILAAGALTQGVFAPKSWAEQPHPRLLASPALLPEESKLSLAAIEDPGTPDARILVSLP